MTTPIDIERCAKALKNISVVGVPNSHVRLKALADAISKIQKNGETALVTEYIGVKNYAHFGDQREDHSYGYGPKHGSIVFSIRRQKDAVLGDDEIYLLECVRDFGSAEPVWLRDYDRTSPKVNLCDVILKWKSAKDEEAKAYRLLQEATVESHEMARAEEEH